MADKSYKAGGVKQDGGATLLDKAIGYLHDLAYNREKFALVLSLAMFVELVFGILIVKKVHFIHPLVPNNVLSYSSYYQNDHLCLTSLFVRYLPSNCSRFLILRLIGLHICKR